MLRFLFFCGIFIIAFIAKADDSSTEPLAPTESTPPQTITNYPKNIILFIGDGMGITIRTISEIYLNHGNILNPETYQVLIMNQMPVTGWCRTFSHNSFVTDSAASGTAFACGQKTNYGTLGLNPNNKPIESLLIKAKKAGWKTGLISSIHLDHATPAAFYAHVPHREMFKQIVSQIPQDKNKIDFLGGGSFIRWNSAQERLDWMQKNNYFWNQNPLEIIDKPYRFFTDALHTVSMPMAIDRTPQQLNLAQITKVALTHLKNEKGFFLMVEGGKIDSAAHANDLGTVCLEVLDLDNAIKEAVAFQKQFANETLIIVTADHDTGGLNFIGKNNQIDLSTIFKQKISFERLTILLGQAYQKKESSKNILKLIEDNFSLTQLSESQKNELLHLWENMLKQNNPNHFNPILQFIAKHIAAQTGVSWATNGHTAVPVPLSALGCGAEKFNGYYDNTQIFKKILDFIQCQTNEPMTR